MSAMAPQFTSFSIVCSTVCSGADQRKHQSSASLAFVLGIHQWPVNSPDKGPVTWKMFQFDDVIILPVWVYRREPVPSLPLPSFSWPSTLSGERGRDYVCADLQLHNTHPLLFRSETKLRVPLDDLHVKLQATKCVYHKWKHETKTLNSNHERNAGKVHTEDWRIFCFLLLYAIYWSYVYIHIYMYRYNFVNMFYACNEYYNHVSYYY